MKGTFSIKYDIYEYETSIFPYFRSGLLSVSTVARLDRDVNPKQYSVIINAVDAGFPIPETATTTLYVQIDDVNDKPPK